MAVELNILVQIEIRESSYLSGSPRLTVYEDVLYSRDNCLVWMMFVLAQRPITLILMMINSCSYSTNDLVFI